MRSGEGGNASLRPWGTVLVFEDPNCVRCECTFILILAPLPTADSCEVSSKNVIASERTELDYMLAPAYQEKFALFSSELALDAYVSQCKTINYKPPPAGCGHNQTKAGDWSTRNPRGQVGMTPGCYAEISKDSEARDPYGPIDPKTNRSIWTWKSEKELKASKWVGRSEKIYPGSGYNITIPMDPTKARDTIEFLDMENWMDLATRAVFVDLLVYNPNVGLVSLVKLSFEFRPTQVLAAGCICTTPCISHQLVTDLCACWQ